ncbi:hypothetical protein EV384_3050 [Micromonospora kangleipakensis]|uniref:Uncharacterized protein n=1 Tax=Micromonospora kangleipakensis TaxID=1077942 RepID=A0A4Q8B9Y7_9ACTN|nr:hypothetical protein EV384_3050 [Micromonospora kangleipakensis]
MSRIRLGLMFRASREVAEVVRTILDRAMPRGAELYAART